MRNKLKGILSIVVLMALLWIGWYPMRSVCYFGEPDFKFLFIYAIILSLLHLYICGCKLWFSNERLLNYVIPVAFFLVFDAIMFILFLAVGDKHPDDPYSGLYFPNLSQMDYCMVIGFCYWMSTLVIVIATLVIEKIKKR
ncbi:MAG: hypothetical protein J1E62_02580 [Lachnospiraceae bacterium]|nr:hypothetical protein [Lachnospiraceae bacterium]